MYQLVSWAKDWDNSAFAWTREAQEMSLHSYAKTFVVLVLIYFKLFFYFYINLQFRVVVMWHAQRVDDVYISYSGCEVCCVNYKITASLVDGSFIWLGLFFVCVCSAFFMQCQHKFVLPKQGFVKNMFQCNISPQNSNQQLMKRLLLSSG